MSDQGKVNYDAYRKQAGRPGVSAAPLPDYEQLPMELRYAFDAGADAVEAWIAELPVDEDMPGNEPAKVIVVTDADGNCSSSGRPRPQVIIVTEADGRERRFGADRWNLEKDGLTVHRDHDVIARYRPRSWLSVREDGATVPEDLSTVRALGIAKRALEAVARISDPNVAIRLASDALGEIYAETEL